MCLWSVSYGARLNGVVRLKRAFEARRLGRQENRPGETKLFGMPEEAIQAQYSRYIGGDEEQVREGLDSNIPSRSC